MLLESSLNEVRAIEKGAASMEAPEILRRLRVLGGSDFALLLATIPDARFPEISRKLPQMPPEQFQKTWNGNSGYALVERSLNFVQIAGMNFARIAGRTLQDLKILDFGCGYGRLIRAFYFYTDPHNIYGVDPWQKSLEFCTEYRLLGNIAKSEYIPDQLPFAERNIDFAFAHSVFTHLSERSTKACLAAVRKHIAPTGLFLVTIRPIEYWYNNYKVVAGKSYDWGSPDHPFVKMHRTSGFAFHSHGGEQIDGETTYGDTSMSLEWLRAAAPGWEVVGTDRSLADPFQRYVYLSPR